MYECRYLLIKRWKWTNTTKNKWMWWTFVVKYWM